MADGMLMVDLTAMSDSEIDAYARKCVAESGCPDGDPGPLASALKNATARDLALKDPYWRDLANIEADEWSGDPE